MNLPTIKLPAWLHTVLAFILGLVWVATLAACFALTFEGRDVPPFAAEQLTWMTIALGAILAIPRNKPTEPADPTDTPGPLYRANISAKVPPFREVPPSELPPADPYASVDPATQ